MGKNLWCTVCKLHIHPWTTPNHNCDNCVISLGQGEEILQTTPQWAWSITEAGEKGKKQQQQQQNNIALKNSHENLVQLTMNLSFHSNP